MEEEEEESFAASATPAAEEESLDDTTPDSRVLPTSSAVAAVQARSCSPHGNPKPKVSSTVQVFCLTLLASNVKGQNARI